MTRAAFLPALRSRSGARGPQAPGGLQLPACTAGPRPGAARSCSGRGDAGVAAGAQLAPEPQRRVPLAALARRPGHRRQHLLQRAVPEGGSRSPHGPPAAPGRGVTPEPAQKHACRAPWQLFRSRALYLLSSPSAAGCRTPLPRQIMALALLIPC